MGMSWGARGTVLDDGLRDACLHTLGDHYAAGRLGLEDLDARIQFALAAETEEDLASAMSGLVDEPVTEQHEPGSGAEAPTSAVSTQVGVPDRALARGLAATLARGAVACGVLAGGGAVVALVGPGSDVVELGAGASVGLLGFLAHWALTARPHLPVGTQQPADEGATARPPAPDLSDAGAGILVDPQLTRPPAGPPAAGPPAAGPLAAPVFRGVPVPRRVRTNSGVIPTQRRSG